MDILPVENPINAIFAGAHGQASARFLNQSMLRQANN